MGSLSLVGYGVFSVEQRAFTELTAVNKPTAFQTVIDGSTGNCSVLGRWVNGSE